ncbi:MAG: hypothetical protein VZR53_14050 [Prevotella sp.]|nr:hypothetical protein [Prevotella sp.]
MEKLIKRKSIFLVLLTALLFLTSCVQSVSGSSTQTASDNDESKVLFKGSINLESSLARSASPVAIDMTSHEFYVIATPKNGEAFEVEVDQTERTFEIPLSFGEWKIESGIRKTANQQKILIDTFTANLLVNTPTFSHAFYLKPVNEGTGTIRLEMTVPSTVVKMGIVVHSKPEGAEFDTSECTASGDQIILERENVACGTYNLVLTFYNSGNDPVFSTIQTVNVVPGLETTKWVSGSNSTLISAGVFEVTDELITVWRTQRNKYYVDSTSGSNSNAGGPLDPFETLSHAVSIINDIYGTETKEVTIIIADGFEETLSDTIALEYNKTITIHAEDDSGAKLIRNHAGSCIKIPSSSNLTLEGLIIDGAGISGSGNVGIHNEGTFIMNSGKICGNNNTTAGGGAGVYSPGVMELNGGEISGNVSNGNGAGILLDSQNIAISGGIVKNNLSGSTPSNLFLPSGSKIKVERAIANGSEINISLGWTPKKVTANTATFTDGYGTYNSTKDPASVFKSDVKYYIIPITSESLVEAGIALSGKTFENVFSSYKMTFAVHNNFNKFMPSDTDHPENRTIQIDPTVIFNTDDITDTVRDSITWKLTLYYRGGFVGEENSNVMVIPTNASYTGRYDLHVYAQYLGLQKDAEFVITGYNNIIPVSADNIKETFEQITNGGMQVTRDTCIDLSSDVDLSGDDFIPMGATINDEGRKSYKNSDFEGTFDGNGNTIKVKADRLVSVDFYTICYCNKGTIQNVIIECIGDVELYENYDPESGEQTYGGGATGKFRRYGGICSTNEGTIRNCWTKANVKGKFFGYIGGICGVNGGLIENCVNTGNLTDMIWGFSYSWGGQYGEAGGITGRNSTKGVVRNCVNYGTVELKNKVDNSSCLNGSAGAICGVCTHGTSEIKNCYWRENCVNTGTSSSPSLKNWVVFQPAHYGKSSVTNGSFEGNGWFVSNNGTSLTAGDAVIGPSKTWNQSLQYGSDLLTALNTYVNATDPNHAYLREWEATSSYAAVLKKQ